MLSLRELIAPGGAYIFLCLKPGFYAPFDNKYINRLPVFIMECNAIHHSNPYFFLRTICAGQSRVAISFDCQFGCKAINTIDRTMSVKTLNIRFFTHVGGRRNKVSSTKGAIRVDVIIISHIEVVLVVGARGNNAEIKHITVAALTING